MTWRIGIEHVSHYEYAGVVLSSYNEVRVTPLTTDTQAVIEANLEIQPRPSASPLHYRDYWGSEVWAFDLDQPHQNLTIVGRSTVETSAPRAPERNARWDELDSGEDCDQFCDLLDPTPRVPRDPRLSEVAAGTRAAHEPAGAARAAIEWVRSELDYVPGSTGVHTSALEAWGVRKGVCQDFAHLALALLRSMGIPARYCSGYLHPDAEADVGPALDGQSHAWVEAWTGGWWALDPTIGGPVSERHVLVARGRDYADVAPVKGVYNGGPTRQLDVSVRLSRLS